MADTIEIRGTFDDVCSCIDFYQNMSTVGLLSIDDLRKSYISTYLEDNKVRFERVKRLKAKRDAEWSTGREAEGEVKGEVEAVDDFPFKSCNHFIGRVTKNMKVSLIINDQDIKMGIGPGPVSFPLANQIAAVVHIEEISVDRKNGIVPLGQHFGIGNPCRPVPVSHGRPHLGRI